MLYTYEVAERFVIRYSATGDANANSIVYQSTYTKYERDGEINVRGSAAIEGGTYRIDRFAEFAVVVDDYAYHQLIVITDEDDHPDNHPGY